MAKLKKEYQKARKSKEFTGKIVKGKKTMLRHELKNEWIKSC